MTFNFSALSKMLLLTIIVIPALFLPVIAASPLEKAPIKIGISTSFPPFNYKDANGEIQGYNADVARAICEKMQTLCEFSPMPFPEIIPALEQGLVQFAPSNFLWTPERAARINFSEKYYRSTTSLVGLSKDSFEDPMVLLQQNEATIAAAHSSAQWRYLHQHSAAQVVSVDTIAKGMQALEKGEVDYILLPTLFALNFLQRPENTHLDFIGEPIDAKSLTGDVHIGISKTQPELKDKIDKAIQSLVSSGELRVLILKYFPFNVY